MSETQDLAELETAFAKDPSSPAFIALSSAYLQQGRFMEAMVVCKKGIKSHPDNVEGRLLLVRVYAEQGKASKALEEMKALLEQKPDVSGTLGARVHFCHAQILDKSGRADEAVEAWKEALRRDRGFADATQALQDRGIDWSPGPSPEEVAAAEAARQAEEEARRRVEEEARRRVEEEAARAVAEAQAAARAEALRAAQLRRSLPPTGPGTDPPMQGYAGAYGMFSGPVPVATANRKFGPGFTFGLASLGVVILVGLILALKANKKDEEELAFRWKAATRLVQTDSTAGHKGAVKELEAALKVDEDQPRVLGQYALSLAILAFERGERDFEKAAEAAVARAAKVADEQPAAIAAQMILLRRDAPDKAAALADKAGKDMARLPLAVRVALGRTYAKQGKVQDMLKVAETLKDVPDPSALTFVGEAFRRVGEAARARQTLDNLMKNGLDHDPGRALRALIILENDDSTNLNVAIDDLRTLKEFGKDATGTLQRGFASLGMAVVGRKIGRPARENDLELDAAKRILGSNPEVPLFEAKLALAADDTGKAIAFAQEAIKRDGVRLGPYLALVEAALRAKNWAAADKAIADATAVFGDNLEIGLARGNRLSVESKHDAAVAHLKGMLTTHDVAEVYHELGRVSLRHSDVNQGVGWLKKAAEKAKNRSPAVQAKVYTALGKAYALAGDHSAAETIFGESLAATSEYSVTYWWLGLSLERLSKGGAARDAFRRYVNAEPNGQYAAKAKDKLNGG